MSKKLVVIPFFFALLFVFCIEAFASPAQNERLVIRSLRTLQAAQVTYQATSGNGNYGTFQNLVQTGLIDSALATGLKYGYNFQIVAANWSPNIPATLQITATPLGYRKTGRRSFFIDESGILRGADKNGAAATVTDPEIEDECLPREECTIANLRMLHSAEITYSATSGNGNYASFSQLRAEGLINAGLATGSRNGYNFTYQTVDRIPGVSEASFKLWATPITYGVTGRRSFYIGTDGVIHGADKNGGLADENDPPLNY